MNLFTDWIEVLELDLSYIKPSKLGFDGMLVKEHLQAVRDLQPGVAV